MDNTTERIYIGKIKDGDTAAYAYLVDFYKHMAYTIALRILRNEEDAEDASQESFIKAYQQIHQFEGKSKFSTWLYTIVYRTAIAVRKEKRIQTYSITDSINQSYTDPQPYADNLELLDKQHYVTAAIKRLSETEGLVITLYYINENTVREIQQITGLSMANIKIKLFRARKKLERDLNFLIEVKIKASNG